MRLGYCETTKKLGRGVKSLNFDNTFDDLKETMDDMVRIVHDAPPEGKKYARHLNRLGVVAQYAYYVSVCRKHLKDKDSIIFDWGGAVWPRN